MSHIICSDLTFLAKAGRVFFTVFVILSSTTNLPSGQCKTLRSSENSHDWFFEMPGKKSENRNLLIPCYFAQWDGTVKNGIYKKPVKLSKIEYC